MVPASCLGTDAVPPPAYQRALAKRPPSLQVTAPALVAGLALLPLCQPASAGAGALDAASGSTDQGLAASPLILTRCGLQTIAEDPTLLTIWRSHVLRAV